jgi:GxxExxY protein
MKNACDKFLEEFYPHQELTDKIIAAAIEVHRELGPGFVEQIYENALSFELTKRGHDVKKQIAYDVRYHEQLVGQHRLDLLVDNTVVLELKSVDSIVEVHVAQLRSTLKAAGKRIGLLMNFNQKILVDGLRRVIN